MSIAKTISPLEAGKLLGKSRESVVDLIRAGEIVATDERMPGSKIPRYRIDPAELARWRERRTVQPVVTDAPRPAVRRVVGLLERMRK